MMFIVIYIDGSHYKPQKGVQNSYVDCLIYYYITQVYTNGG